MIKKGLAEWQVIADEDERQKIEEMQQNRQNTINPLSQGMKAYSFDNKEVVNA
jgi:hypothetical protein